MDNLMVGSIIHFVLREGLVGECRAAIVTSIADPIGQVNLRVFMDSVRDYPDAESLTGGKLMESTVAIRRGVAIDHSIVKEPGTWHFLEECKSNP